MRASDIVERFFSGIWCGLPREEVRQAAGAKPSGGGEGCRTSLAVFPPNEVRLASGGGEASRGCERSREEVRASDNGGGFPAEWVQLASGGGKASRWNDGPGREEWGRSNIVGSGSGSDRIRTEEKCGDAREEEVHRRLAKGRQGGG